MNTLAELLSSRVKAEIFRLLFGGADGELHVREIERRSGLADATVRQELKRLTRLGLVEPSPTVCLRLGTRGSRLAAASK